MKYLIVLSVLCVFVACHGVSAGIRVIRDTEDDVKTHGEVPDLAKILAGALKRVRSKANDALKADVDKVQTALDSGALQQSLDQIKADLANDKFDLRKVIVALRERAPPELKEEVNRIIMASQSALEKIHDRVHHHAGKLDEKLRAAADSAATEA